MQHSGIIGYGLTAKKLWVQSPATTGFLCGVSRISSVFQFSHYRSHTHTRCIYVNLLLTFKIKRKTGILMLQELFLKPGVQVNLKPCEKLDHW